MKNYKNIFIASLSFFGIFMVSIANGAVLTQPVASFQESRNYAECGGGVSTFYQRVSGGEIIPIKNITSIEIQNSYHTPQITMYTSNGAGAGIVFDYVSSNGSTHTYTASTSISSQLSGYGLPEDTKISYFSYLQTALACTSGYCVGGGSNPNVTTYGNASTTVDFPSDGTTCRGNTGGETETGTTANFYYKITYSANAMATILTPASGATIMTQAGYLSHFLVDTELAGQPVGPLIYYSVSVSYQKGDDTSTLGNVWKQISPETNEVVDIPAILPLEYGATYKINASVWQQIRSFATGTEDIWNNLYQGENQYFTVASTSTNPFQGNGFQGGSSTSLPFSSSTFCGVQVDCSDPAVASSTWTDFTCHLGNGVKGLCGFVLTPLNGAWNTIYGFIIKSFPINIFYAINEDIERVKSNITATSTPIIVPIFGHDIEVLSSDVISDSGRGIVDWRDIFTKLIWVFLGGIIIVEAILLVGHFKSQKN